MASSLAIKNTLQNTDYGTLNAHVAESTSLLPFKLDVPYKTIQNDNEKYYVSKIHSHNCVHLLYKLCTVTVQVHLQLFLVLGLCEFNVFG